MHEIRFRPGLRPGPRWESSRRSPSRPNRLGRGFPLPISHHPRHLRRLGLVVAPANGECLHPSGGDGRSCLWQSLEVPTRYFEGPLFRKFIVQIRATVLTFALGLRLGLWSVLGIGLRLVEIVDFQNSGPSE